jgi:iron complex transport system substrate-binding protein
LLPSATEIVSELGLFDLLVGRSEECDWPPAVAELPVVSSSRVDTSELSGREVDDAVRAAVAGGQSLYALDEELLRLLEPNLVLTQELCAVCAVSATDVCALDVPSLALDPRTLDGIAATLCTVAGALGYPDRGIARANRMLEDLAEVAHAVEGLQRPRVFLAEWVDPPYAPGHWLAEMVELAGGECVIGRPGAHSFRTDWEEIRKLEPEVVVFAPCGYDADRAAQEPVPDLQARVVAVDASAFYARPAPRVVDGTRQLAHLLHPEAVADPQLPVLELVAA